MTRRLSIATVCLLSLTACVGPAPRGGAGVTEVAASFYPLAFFSEKVGGSAVSVTQITPSGVEPHEYEPTPQELGTVESSQVFFWNGRGVDPWAQRIEPELKANGILTMAAVTPVALLQAHDGNRPDSETDPHVWLDPVRAQAIVQGIRDTLVKADPAHITEFQTRAAALIAELSALDQEYKTGLATCTLREIITSHDAFRYIAARYGFASHAVSGFSPEEEPSAKRIAELADLAKAKHIDTIFFETLVNPKLSQTIAEEAGAKSAVLNPIEGLSPDDLAAGHDYLSVMRENLAALHSAMHCS